MSKQIALLGLIIALQLALLLKHWRHEQLLSIKDKLFGSPNDLNNYKVRLLSFEPFVAHLEDFISPAERRQLLHVATPLLNRSTVRDVDGSERLTEGRTSSTAKLPIDDPVVLSILGRAAEFQGYTSIDNMEIQLTSYREGEQYKTHFDWHGDRSSPGLTDRATTFFIVLEASCSDCGTRFPWISMNWTERDERWCGFVDCNNEELTSKPVPGSALFWRNLNENGSGIFKTAHAGLKVEKGSKVGLNIWTRVNVTSPIL